MNLVEIMIVLLSFFALIVTFVSGWVMGRNQLKDELRWGGKYLYRGEMYEVKKEK